MTDVHDSSDRQDTIRHYGAAALAGILTNLSEATEGSRNETLNTCSYAAEQLAGAGALVAKDAIAALLAAAISAGLSEQEALATIRSGFEAGLLQPRNLDHIGRRPRRQRPGRRAPAAHPIDAGRQDDREQRRRTDERLARSLRRLRALPGTPAERYLMTRGLTRRDLEGMLDLGHIQDLAYYDSARALVGYFNALVGLVRDCRTGEIISLHRTYLSDDGAGKAAVEAPKKFLSPVRDGHVSLGNVLGAEHIGVGEGIESSLSLSGIEGIPTSALLSTSLFSRFVPGGKVRRVTIAADNDKSGLEAASGLADRLRAAGIRVRIVVMPEPYSDINEALCARGREAVKAVIDATPWLEPEKRGPPRGASKAAGRDNWLYDSTCVAAVEARNIAWLWQPRIALGKVTLFSGNPGQGKSQLTAYLAACTSRGDPFIDGQPCPRGSVIMIACEDDVADTIRPRLEAAGADLAKVHILNAVRHREDGNKEGKGEKRQRLSDPHAFNLADGLEGLRAMIDEIGDVKLIVLDPVSAYLSGADSHKNAEVRELLLPVQQLAAEKEIALVLVTHLNKASGMDAMARSMGSIAFVAAARAAHLVHRDPADQRRRLFLPVKNNIGIEGEGLAFTIEEAVISGNVKTSKIVMDPTPVAMTADEALAGNVTGDAAIPSVLDDAKQWLEGALSAGPRRVKELLDEAEQEKIAGKTLRRAKRALGVIDTRVGFGEGSYSEWRLSDSDAS